MLYSKFSFYRTRCDSSNPVSRKSYLQKATVFIDPFLFKLVEFAFVRVFFVKEKRVFPSGSEIADSEGMVGVEFGELFGECLNRREHKLKRYFDDRVLAIFLFYPFKLFHLFIEFVL